MQPKSDNKCTTWCPQKKYTSITINIVFQKKCISLISCVSKHMCVCACVPTKALLHMHTFIYMKCNFCALTCLLSMWCIPKHTMGYWTKGNKSRNAQGKSTGHKKGSNQSDRSKLKRRVGMERCLPVECVGENGSSIGVLDRKKKTKRHKKENNQISTFQPFKTEKNGKDGKVLTCRARRRRRFVNRSPE